MPEVTSQVRYAFPKYKVFIYGIEVSDDVVSITTNSHDGNSPNTCHVTLLNDQDKYIITTQDMINLNSYSSNLENLNIPWMTEDGVGSTSGTLETSPGDTGGVVSGQALYDRLNAGTILSKRKMEILSKKNEVANQVLDSKREGPTGDPIDKSFTNYYGQSIVRYPIVDGAPVFHSMDPVRVFMRDPYDSTRWYHHFSGFVSDMVDNTGTNNDKTLTIVVEDPTKLFRYTRFFINPGILDSNVVVTDKDLKAQSFNAQRLQGYSLPEALFSLLFGPEKVPVETLTEAKDSAGGTVNKSTALRGVGHFSYENSVICTIGPDPVEEASVQTSTGKDDANNISKSGKRTPKTKLFNDKVPEKLDSLETWQSLIDHEVQPSDLWTMLSHDIQVTTSPESIADQVGGDGTAYAPDGKLDQEAIINFIGKHPEMYFIDGGRLMVLIPNSLGANNNRILIEDIIQSYPMQSEWTSFGNILYELVERIQFIMYCTPKGDLVVEPPLFDFDPDDFGLAPSRPGQFQVSVASPDTTHTSSGGFVELQKAELHIPSRSRGPFGKAYRILKRDTIGWESAFVDEKVHTMATVAHQIVQNWQSVGDTSIIGDMAVPKLVDLIPLYGVRCVPITPPGYLATREGAYLFGHITLNKMNADAHTVKVNHLPNIRLGLNRPIYVEGRNFIGTTKQISHTIVWGQSGEMNTVTDLYAARTWNGQVSKLHNNQPIYSAIGGMASSPLNYAILFKKKDPPLKTDESNNGINKSNDTDAIGKKSPKAAKSIKDSKNAAANANKIKVNK